MTPGEVQIDRQQNLAVVVNKLAIELIRSGLQELKSINLEIPESDSTKMAQERISIAKKKKLHARQILGWFNNRDQTFGGYGWALCYSNMNPNRIREKINKILNK